MIASALPNRPGDELATKVFDALMEEINPDLLTRNIPGIDSSLAGMDASQKTEKQREYEDAYARFDVALRDLLDGIGVRVKESRRHALIEREKEDRNIESNAMSSLEQAFG